MNTIGKLLELGQGKIRSLDSIVVIPLQDQTPKDLIEGAQFAQSCFPQTTHLTFKILRDKSLDEFVNETEGHEMISQLILKQEGKRFLAFKMSHVIGDGFSMLLWLRAQLFREVHPHELTLKRFPPKKDTPYRRMFVSKVWPQKIKNISNQRGFVTRTLNHHESRVNDQLILGLFKTLGSNSSVWMPVNIRENPRSGFGNALSRMRIYPSKTKLTDREHLDYISRQKKEAMTNGEVFSVPDDFELNSPAKELLFKAWINRPWADWGSISLSHMTKAGLGEVKAIPPISPHHAAVIMAVTEGAESFVTLTFDKALVSEKEASHFLDQWQGSLDALSL